MESKRLKVFRQKINRKNLVYEVHPKPETKESAINLVVNLVNERFKQQSGLIYTSNVQQCEDVWMGLKEKEVSCLPYHGEKDIDIRKKTQRKWSNDKCQVLVCTEAFGLGINKADVALLSILQHRLFRIIIKNQVVQDVMVANHIVYYYIKQKILQCRWFQRLVIKDRKH